MGLLRLSTSVVEFVSDGGLRSHVWSEAKLFVDQFSSQNLKTLHNCLFEVYGPYCVKRDRVPFV